MTKANPWYREPWTWGLMAGPAIVVVAGAITTVIAVKTSDGLVADDYYKQGLAVNRVIAREERAQALGIAAMVQFNEERERVRVSIAMPTQPQTLHLVLAHPTRAGEDRRVVLERSAAGLYEGKLIAPRAGTYHVQLEDPDGHWRLTGEWRSSAAQVDLGVAP